MEQQPTNMSTWAVYDFKDDIKVQYQIAYNLLAEYIINPRAYEQEARTAVLKLMYPLFPKLYVLNDVIAVDYTAYYMSHPDELELFELQTVFLILQRVIEKIGITKFEQFQIPKHKAYLESE